MKSSRPPRDPGSDAADGLAELGFDGGETWLECARRAEASDAFDEIAGYRVLDVCAHGGQGTVYRARRADGRVVALKRIHGGANATPSSRRRLAAELEAAAHLSHPNIVPARPVRSNGELLLEMDWIDGLALTEWARGPFDAPAPTTAEKLAAFVTICDAIAHAHRAGIIHRDLKPSNILVRPCGEPFVLDFGLAKSIAELCASHSRVTLTEHLLGTPAYASPEQIAGRDGGIDERTDVYSLGVLLYEVFVGASPYRAGLSLGRLLSEVETGRPRRPRAVDRSVPRNVEAVILKAMSKDPDRRYRSVDELKADLERCRAELPAAAPAPGFLFDLRAFARRHPTPSAVACAVLAMLLVTAGIVAAYAWRLDRARDATVRAHDAADRVSRFLGNLLLETDPTGEGVRAMLDEAAGWIDEEFGDDEWARARAGVTFGRMYAKLGAWAQADRHLTEALETYRGLGPRDRREVAETLRLLGLARAHLGRPQALEIQREAMAMIGRLGPPAYRPPLAEFHAALGETLLLEKGAGGRAEADACYERAVEILGGDDPPFPGWTASLLAGQARGLAGIGDNDDAIGVLERALALFDGDDAASTDPYYRECSELLASLKSAGGPTRGSPDPSNKETDG